MMIYELDKVEKEALLSTVVKRARADLNDGRPLTEMRHTSGTTHRKDEQMNSQLTTSDEPVMREVSRDVEWLSGLPSRFPTHGSVKRLQTLLIKIAAASTYDPGESDLDDEQPISLTIDLGDVRMARRLIHRL